MADEQEVNSTPTEPEKESKPAIDLEDRKTLGGEVDRKYIAWREPRRSHELQWFITAAYKHGKQTNEAVQTLNSVQDIGKLNRRKKNIANKLWAKHRARFAKFARSRPKAFVVPFNSDRQSRLDARATEKSLDYFYNRSQQEQAYLDVIQHASETGKAYWWIYYNPKAQATLRQTNKETGTVSVHDFEGGEVEVQVDSAFPVLVPDLRRTHIWEQPEIMRVRVMDVDDMKAEYPDFAEYIKPDSHISSPFEFERQIAHLSGSEAGALASMSSDMKGKMTGVLVKENYIKPNAKYPRGRFIVVMNGIAVKDEEELPFGFSDMVNPYPCVEFMDMPQVGQFYTTTFLEQLIPLQRGYNMLRDKLETQIRLNTHPKWVVARQARVPKASITNEAGEVIEFNFIPGMPEPHPIQPGNVAADAWRFAQMLGKEFDEISQLQPAFEGRAGGAKSGVQTNLLQEASDSVHAPDGRGFELAFLDASYKVRRLMKQFYDVPRLISFAGRANTPEMFEFSEKNIDEHASIMIQVGSALSTFKATRIQQMLDLHEKGLLGDPNDPELKRRVLGLLDIGGLEQFQEEARRDEDMARSENIDMLTGMQIPVPYFYEDHMAHYAAHTDELKSPANKELFLAKEEIKRGIIAHTLLHMKWINPTAAYGLAMELGFEQELVLSGLIKPPQPPIAPPPAAGPTPPPGGGAPTPSPVAAPAPTL
jgi:hypothetical protein